MYRLFILISIMNLRLFPDSDLNVNKLVLRQKQTSSQVGHSPNLHFRSVLQRHFLKYSKSMTSVVCLELAALRVSPCCLRS